MWKETIELSISIFCYSSWSCDVYSEMRILKTTPGGQTFSKRTTNFIMMECLTYYWISTRDTRNNGDQC